MGVCKNIYHLHIDDNKFDMFSFFAILNNRIDGLNALYYTVIIGEEDYITDILLFSVMGDDTELVNVCNSCGNASITNVNEYVIVGDYDDILFNLRDLGYTDFIGDFYIYHYQFLISTLTLDDVLDKIYKVGMDKLHTIDRQVLNNYIILNK